MEAARKDFNPHLGYLDDVVGQYRGLVWKVATRFRWATTRFSSIQMEDLVSEGYIGLIKAFRRYDPEQFVGVQKFVTYAFPTIYGHIQKYLERHGHAVKPSRETYTRVGHILRNQLEGSSTKEVAQTLHCSLVEAEDTLKFLRHSNVVYLDQSFDSPEEDGTTAIERIGSEDDPSQAWVNEFLESLNPRYRQVAEMRLAGMLQVDIARQINVSQVHVGRILTKIGVRYCEYAEIVKKKAAIESEVAEMDQLTKEKYLARKKQGATDADIMRDYPMSSSTLHRKKAKWGIATAKGRSTATAVIVQGDPLAPAIDEEKELLRTERDHWRTKYVEATQQLEKFWEQHEAAQKREHGRLVEEINQLKSLLKFYL